MQHKKAIILFDGICNLCNNTVDFLLKYDRKKQFRYVSLQSDEGKILLHNFQIPDDTDSVILINQNRLFLESDAIIEIAEKLNYPWKLGITGKLIPKKIRDRLYRIISKNRYRWFGKRKDCRITPFDES